MPVIISQNWRKTLQNNQFWCKNKKWFWFRIWGDIMHWNPQRVLRGNWLGFKASNSQSDQISNILYSDKNTFIWLPKLVKVGLLYGGMKPPQSYFKVTQKNMLTKKGKRQRHVFSIRQLVSKVWIWSHHRPTSLSAITSPKNKAIRKYFFDRTMIIDPKTSTKETRSGDNLKM